MSFKGQKDKLCPLKDKKGRVDSPVISLKGPNKADIFKTFNLEGSKALKFSLHLLWEKNTLFETFQISEISWTFWPPTRSSCKMG